MSETTPPSGLEAAFLAHRETLLRFLRARGAGEAAEDILHEVWLRVSTRESGPVAAPLAYLHSVANSLMIDRYRSQHKAQAREREWSAAQMLSGEASPQPSAEREVFAAREAARVLAMLDGLGARVAQVFRLHRVEGMAQKDVARKVGIGLSTVEGDLRKAYRALEEWKRHGEGEEP